MKKPHKPLTSAGLLLLVAFVATGCTTTRWVNTGGYWLESVDTPDHIANPVLTEKGVYVDDSLTVRMEMWDDGFDIHIKNLGKEPLVIRWNECRYTDEMGTTHKVTHMKNRYLLIGATVKGGAVCDDFLAPADAQDSSGDELTPLWRIHSYKNKAEAEAARPDSSSVSVTLALQRGGVTDDYIFTFAGDDYQTSKVEVFNEERALFLWDLTLILLFVLSVFTAILLLLS